MASLAEKRMEDAEDHPVDQNTDQAARPEELRLLEALLFASAEPIDQAALAKRMPDGVDVKGTLDVLLETGWIRPRGRRKTPGRPLTFGTTEAFLSQFSLEALGDLPGLEELKGTGLLDSRLPSGFSVPTPSDDVALREDEDPLDAGDNLELLLAPAAEPEEGGGS